MNPSNGWIDIHTHLDKLDVSPEVAIADANAAGVSRMITIGTEPNDHTFVVEMTQNFPNVVFGTLGVHPHEAQLWSPEVGIFIRNNSNLPGIVAVGEIGLDFFYEHAERDIQFRAFREQMELAHELKLPVEIHTRDAEQDTIGILKEFRGRVQGVLHCFTSSWTLAEAALDCGYDISLSGIVTFKSADDLRETAKKTPLNRLHIETDAPFLSPIPVRGKKNIPAHMIHTAKLVAELKNIPLEVFRNQMLENAERCFPKLASH